MRDFFHKTFVRYHMTRPDTLVVMGYFPCNNKAGYHLEVEVDKQPAEAEIIVNKGNEVRRRYFAFNQNISTEYTIIVPLKNKLEEVKSFTIYSVNDSARLSSYSANQKELKAIALEVQYNLEMSYVDEENYRLMGWMISNDASTEDIKLLDGEQEIDITVNRKYRQDIIGCYPELSEDINAGLEVLFPKKEYSSLRLKLSCDGRENIIPLDMNVIRTGGLITPKKSPYVRAKEYLHYNGMPAAIKKAYMKLMKKQETYTYTDFNKAFAVTDRELAAQRIKAEELEYKPLFSICIPLYNTPVRFLDELINSISVQTYTNWQLCLADGSQENEAQLIEAYIKGRNSTKIKYHKLEKNLGISENTNEALKMAEGEYIVLSDHDDLVAPNALYELALALNNNRNIDAIYSDEDKVSMDSKEYFEPNFKPDFSMDYLCSVNYICHIFAFRKTLLEDLGGFRSEYDGAQDHDFFLRICEKSKEIYHIPKVLYHWRCHMNSTAMNAASKDYAFDNGAKAVSDHYKRVGIEAYAVRGEFPGLYRTVYQYKDMPLVSIIIPNKDHTDDLEVCLRSLQQVNKYDNYEVIIVENNSTLKETFEYYESLKQYDNIQVVTYEKEFNFSDINNFGAGFAKGELLLLLNNDTEIISKDTLYEMAAPCMREEIGIVGAALYYPDDTYQHAGVIIGVGGCAGHAFTNLPMGQPGYMFRAMAAQNLSAVTAAALMVRKDIYDKVGGLTVDYQVAFNDIDFCLKVRREGYKILYNPNATFHHFESKSRGLENTSERVARFNREVARLEEDWGDVIKAGDPYYNPNLSLMDGDYNLNLA